MKNFSLTTLLQDSELEVDFDHSEIRNIAAITKGLTKHSTLPPFMIDDVSLAQVAATINAHPNGVQSRVTHPEVMGSDGLFEKAGKVKNARVVGDKVIVDFVLGSYASNDTKRLIFGLANEAPEDAGLSIMGGEAAQFDEVDGQNCLRITTMHAVDWTGNPAANPAGMLSANTRELVALMEGKEAMFNEAQMELLRGWGLDPDADDAAIAEFVTGLDAEQTGELAGAGDPPAAMEDGEEEPAAAMEDEHEDPPTAMEDDEEEPAAAAEGEDEDEDPVAASAAQPKTISLATLKEATELAALGGQPVDVVCAMLQEEKSIDDIRTHMVALKAAEKEPIAMGAIKITQDGRAALSADIRDGLLFRGNRSRFANDESISREAKQFANLSVIGMGREWLIALGATDASRLAPTEVFNRIMGPRRFAKAYPALAQSTSDFGELMTDAINKSLRTAYNDAPSSWELWARRETAADFKTIHRVAMSESPDLVSRTEGGEVQYVDMTDSEETYALVEYVSGLRLTRKAIINDDLSAFDRLPQMQAMAAKRKEDDVAYAILTANANLADGVALFSTATTRSNLASSGGALTVATLQAGFAAMFNQQGPQNAAQLELGPSFLLVPGEAKGTADQLINSTVDPAANSGHALNPYTNQLEVVPSARLGANSTTAWYLVSDYRGGQVDTVEVSFLEGEEEPVLDQETDFDTDDQKFKVRHTVAAKAIDFRGLYKNAGA